MLFGGSTYGYNDINNARLAGAHIINCSWISNHTQELEDVVYNALNEGRIVVAAAGNSQAEMGTIPRVVYPAGYYFSDLGKEVIAVSATHLNGNTEVFGYPPDGRWNYSPFPDPLVNPDEAFIDFSAPGVFIKVLHPTIPDQYITQSGTSLSAPIVAGTIGLMKSVNMSLTPEAVFEILKKTAEKVGLDTYNNEGWNQYMGYGRINAHNAVNVAAGAPYPPERLYVDTYSTLGPISGELTANADLQWMPNSEPDLDYYKIYKAATTGSEPEYNDFILIGTSSTASATVSVSDFGDDKKIYYRISAVNTSGKESVLSESGWDWAPPEPPAISITPSGGHPKIYWNASSLPGMSYKVYRKIGKMNFFYALQPIVTDTLFIDTYINWDGTHVINEEKVYYKVAKIRRDSVFPLISNFSNTVYAWREGDPPNKKGVEKEDTPATFGIEQNYPNPFNPTTIIKYQLPEAVNVTIKLYDMLGREVKEFINDTQEAGYYELNFDGSDLSSGTYIYRITAGDFTDSKKLLLLK